MLQLSHQPTIDDEVRESRTLDFKEQFDLSKDGQHPLTEGVCAFVDTVGATSCSASARATAWRRNSARLTLPMSEHSRSH